MDGPAMTVKAAMARIIFMLHNHSRPGTPLGKADSPLAAV
jgi:hypothetical protein